MIRSLYDRGLGPEDIQQLFRLIDWMLILPMDLDAGFWDEVDRFEKERKVPYVTSVERLGLKRGRKEGLKKGRQQGLREGVLEWIAFDLEAKFDSVDAQLMEEIKALKDIDQLRKVARGLKKARTMNQIRSLLDS